MTRHELYLLAKSIKHCADRLGMVYDRHDSITREFFMGDIAPDALADMQQCVNPEDWYEPERSGLPVVEGFGKVSDDGTHE